jgi:hypothetical protein
MVVGKERSAGKPDRTVMGPLDQARIRSLASLLIGPINPGRQIFWKTTTGSRVGLRRVRPKLLGFPGSSQPAARAHPSLDSWASQAFWAWAIPSARAYTVTWATFMQSGGGRSGRFRPRSSTLCPERVFVANKLLRTLCPVCDLADHPGLKQIAKGLQASFVVVVRLPRSGRGMGRWHPTANA